MQLAQMTDVMMIGAQYLRSVDLFYSLSADFDESIRP